MPVQVLFATSAQADLDELSNGLLIAPGSLPRSTTLDASGDTASVLRNFPNAAPNATSCGAGLRTVGFERRITIASTIQAERVIILRILYAGRSLERAFRGDEAQ